jgi:small conductance mechanosensitive channel
MPEGLLATLLPIMLHVGAAIATLLVGRWLAGRSRTLLGPALRRTDLTESLIRLFCSLAYAGILIVAILTALAFVGVPLQALLASAGIVIIVLGVALRESLANFAATVIFLLFPAYKIGDVIETCGVTGSVTEILLFHTVLTTFDKTVVTLPNGEIQNKGVTNRSQIGILRADVDVGIRYESDLVQAKHILEQLLAEDERVLQDPPPAVFVLDLVSSGVILAARPFTKFADNFALKCDLKERVKLRFDEAGIEIAYPLLGK